uniref:Uncharacterized protein n=1 Tax=Hyaloperonospora arabidopsidis (strain Emoy2) TaxID=559515 RepID=M4BQ66_HYAAE
MLGRRLWSWWHSGSGSITIQLERSKLAPTDGPTHVDQSRDNRVIGLVPRQVGGVREGRTGGYRSFGVRSWDRRGRYEGSRFRVVSAREI